MSNRDWDKELAMIDKQLASISDEQLLATPEAAATPPRAGAPTAAPVAPPSARPAAGPAAAGAAAAAPALIPPPGTAAPVGWRTRLALNGKLGLAVAASVGIVFWPYAYRCGADLAIYLAAVAGVTLLGLWAARSTWHHRAGKRHALALLVVGWGISLAAWQALPRMGHAMPTMERPGIWACR
jgi:hypothetical protein